MKQNPFSGSGKVFRYSLGQLCGSKGWLISTFLIAALLLFGIPLGMWAATSADSDDDVPDEDETRIRTVWICDETPGAVDYAGIFREQGRFTDVTYQTAESMDDAAAKTETDDSAVILRVTRSETNFTLTVYLPDNTALSRGKASEFSDFASDAFSEVLMQKAQLTPEGAALLSVPVRTTAGELKHEASADDESERSLLEEFLTIMLPFLLMMTIYMMVVLYGQSLANSVMLEKTSKLMETILTAVHPAALMMGKLFATAAGALLQILIWLFSLIGGVFCGSLIALSQMSSADMANAENDAAAANLTALLENSALHITGDGIAAALLMLTLGFLLYLSLGAVAGALASKQEDLGKTNIVFVLVLVFSMLISLGSPENVETNGLLSDAVWLNFFPFTALLVVPGKLILGKISAGMACGSLLVMAVAVVLMILLAGMIYKMLVLYRGNPPTPSALLRMIRGEKKKSE